MNLKRYISLFIFLTLASQVDLSGTHNRAGEITYEQIGPLTIRATITTYTKASSTSADRDSLELFWGDGTSDLIARANGQGDQIPGEDIKINYYIATHTYPGRTSYTLSFNDPNRVNNIQNVNFPNSVDVRFYVETTFTFTNPQFQGYNNSVILLQPPIDFACVNEKFTHNPNAFDPDGDSLSYELIVPLESKGTEVPKYEFPNEAAQPGPDNIISLNAVTGDFVWDAPKVPGEYNIAIKINEYRNGVLLNSVIRDMQIFVDICSSKPPEIDVIDEICVVAGTKIEIPVIVTDPDSNELVRLSATGGPFLEEVSPAYLSGNAVYTVQPLKEDFIWETRCEHISNEYYQVVFRAQDNSRNTTGLASLKTLRIKVVGPPPTELEAEVIDESIKVSWDFDYECKETVDDYFIGFSVWRKVNPNPFEIDSCIEGLEGKGYEIVKFLTLENDGIQYSFVDDRNLEKGRIYCYRVLANFAQKTPTGNPFNIVESLVSDEICIQLSQDIPLLTKVSVNRTSTSDGAMEIQWIKPLAEDLDTIENPGPYRYDVLKSIDGINYTLVPGASFISNSFSESIPTNFLDTGLNTSQVQYYYRIDFYSDGQFYGSSLPASSVFLNIQSSDNQNILSWNEDVPWENFEYSVFKKEANGSFNAINIVQEKSFTDFDVQNGIDYCYYIESIGTYGLSTTPSPLVNLSQEDCGVPIDSVGPCAPMIIVDNPCQTISEGSELNELVNTLQWSTVYLQCTNSGDLESYNIYYSDNLNTPLEFIDNVMDQSFNIYDHKPESGINGCYAVASVDQVGNEGPLSNTICVENCPVYKLPNTFTPNNDGANELFIPIENKFVSSIELKVFNRWGNLIFETTDPEINWDGTDSGTNDVDNGVYFYVCKVFKENISGGIEQTDLLEGHLQIFR